MIICLNEENDEECGARNSDSANRCHQCGKLLPNNSLRVHDIGVHIRSYRIVDLIGYGGFGAVYKAECSQTGQHVALKQSFDPRHIHTFQGEFNILCKLSDNHLPRYHKMFEEDDNGYLVMELIPGQSLLDVLKKRKGPLDEERVKRYAIQLCNVLTYLHGQDPPLIHRDIKPANIRLTPENVIKLVDFGLLKEGINTTHTSIRGAGTPAYAPLEQWGKTGEHTSPKSDIYSLGATLYHLLTGRLPIVAISPPPRDLNPNVSERVSDALMKALAMHPKDRFADAAEFEHALTGVTPPPQPAPPAPPRTTIPVPPPKVAPTPKPKKPAPSPSPPPTPKLRSAPKAEPTPKPSQKKPKATHKPGWKKKVGMFGIFAFVFIAVATAHFLFGIGVPGPSTLFRTLQGHTRDVFSVAWSPDGTTLASGSGDDTVKLWNAADGTLLRTLQGHTDWVNSVAWSPDGTTLASGSFDETVKLWNAADGTLLRTLQGHTGWVRSVAWSPDGTTLASGSSDETVKLWNAADGTLFRTLQGHTRDVRSVAWSPDGTTLASGSWDNTVKLWNAADGTLLRTLQGHTDNVWSVAWSPDGTTLASGSFDETVKLWKKDGTLLRTLQGHTSSVWSVAWSPDGTTLASA